MTQAFVTVVIPFYGRHEAEVNAHLDGLGNVAGQGHAASPPRTETLSTAELDRLREFVHFLSIVVVPEDGGRSAFLVIELCADGEPGGAVERLVEAIPAPLRTVLEKVGKKPIHDTRELCAILKAHMLQVGTGVFSRTLGLAFAGTPGMSVRRILDEDRLAMRIRGLLDQMPQGIGALARLEYVRAKIFEDADLKWAFMSEPVPLLAPAKPRLDLAKALNSAAWRDFLWPLIPLPVLFGAASLYAGNTVDWALWHFTAALGLEMVLAAVLLKIGYDMLRRQEEEDVPFDAEPDGQKMKEILQHENQPGVAQNHLFAVSVLKPGRIRRTSTRIALWIIGELARGRSRPGFLNRIGTIHFARWVLLPGTNRLLFFSNYDGSWQSYLEDFIARLREGLTSIWSNTRDFPKTANLITGGVAEGTRFKRWARRQQQPTRFWYTAYPHLTTDLIRTHAAIRHGFAAASNESEAAKWLALFGYAEPETVEKEEVCSLAFGGLPLFPCAYCLVLHFSATVSARKWLRKIESDLGYGEHTQLSDRALVTGFTSDGLRKLGLGNAAIASFPTAFQKGMSAPERSRALGDGDTAAWWWGSHGSPQTVDAVLILYAKDRYGLNRQVDNRKREAVEQYGHTVLQEIPLQDLSPGNLEPFGFRDGVSQPIMRGSKHWSEPEYAMHVVEPGELLLGYRDNIGNLNPTPSSEGRDIGRNGTFLVVRQLEQDKAAFDSYVDAQVARLVGRPPAPGYSRADLQHWVAARMVGRWRDGSSLVRNPHPPALSSGGTARPVDNSFEFGREDPDGLRCPLGSHIRRANPRESFEPGSPVQLAITNRHRILRVGRVYEPRPGANSGLLFMCINADIERQFEFIQQTWLLGQNFHGLDNEVDPVVGYRGNGEFTVPTPQGPLRMSGLANFVTTRGGGYFFVPGRSALRLLMAD